MERESKIVKQQRLYQWIIWNGLEPFQMSRKTKNKLFGKSFYRNHCEKSYSRQYNGYIDDHKDYVTISNSITGKDIRLAIEDRYYLPGKYSMTNRFTINAFIWALDFEHPDISRPITTGHYSTDITINHTALKQYYDKLNSYVSSSSYKEYDKQYNPKKSSSAGTLLHRALVTRTLFDYPSMITENYYQHQCNRIIASNGFIINSQNIPSDMRYLLYPEQYDIDMDNCYYTLMYNLALQYGIADQFPNIKEYVTDKESFRNKLAHRWKVEVSQIKLILLSIVFGGSIYYGSIIKTLDYDYNARTAMVNDKLYRDIRDEVSKLGQIIVDAHITDTLDAVISYGKRKEIFYIDEDGNHKKHTLAQLLAFILSGYESKIMDVIIIHHKPTSLLFDGFTSPVMLDMTDLHDMVRDETGFDISFSQKQFKGF